MGRAVELAIEVLHGELHVDDGAAAAIGAHVRAVVVDDVAVAEILVIGAVRGQADRRDAQPLQAEQFSGLRDAILVEIAPHPDIGEPRIARVEDAVAIAVQTGQRRKPGSGLASVRQGRVHSEQLGTVVDPAVAIAVQHQQPIVGGDPAGALTHPVAIVIEQYAGSHPDRLDAVAIEVQRQRIAPRHEVARRGEIATDAVTQAQRAEQVVPEVAQVTDVRPDQRVVQRAHSPRGAQADADDQQHGRAKEAGRSTGKDAGENAERGLQDFVAVTLGQRRQQRNHIQHCAHLAVTRIDQIGGAGTACGTDFQCTGLRQSGKRLVQGGPRTRIQMLGQARTVLLHCRRCIEQELRMRRLPGDPGQHGFALCLQRLGHIVQEHVLGAVTAGSGEHQRYHVLDVRPFHARGLGGLFHQRPQHRQVVLILADVDPVMLQRIGTGRRVLAQHGDRPVAVEDGHIAGIRIDDVIAGQLPDRHVHVLASL